MRTEYIFDVHRVSVWHVTIDIFKVLHALLLMYEQNTSLLAKEQRTFLAAYFSAADKTPHQQSVKCLRAHQSLKQSSASELLKLVQERRDGGDVFAVRDEFALELDAGVCAQLTLEVRTEHLLALRTVAYARAYVGGVGRGGEQQAQREQCAEECLAGHDGQCSVCVKHGWIRYVILQPRECMHLFWGSKRPTTNKYLVHFYL